MADNFARMLDLVNEFFDTRHDPDQISVSDEERQRLEQIHPATLSAMENEDGPMVWILVVPTTLSVMNDFLLGNISEKQLLQRTRPGDVYDAIYLCSASVLPEFRGRGLATKVTLDAVSSIRRDHPVKSLFYWPFSDEGKALARSVANTTGLPLLERAAD